VSDETVDAVREAFQRVVPQTSFVYLRVP